MVVWEMVVWDTQQMTATAIIATDANLNQTHSYSHDLFGNLSALAGTSTEDFEYDHQHRLRNSTRTGIGGFHSISYSYDELGNDLKVTCSGIVPLSRRLV